MKTLFRNKRLLRIYILDLLGVFLACALYAAFVLPSLTTASTYFDEGYSAYLARYDFLSIAQYTALDVHPPLYYAILHMWQGVVGGGAVELRLMSLLFGFVTIAFAFLLVRRLFGRKAAWLSVVLLALSPLFVRYGSSMRMYTMALAIVVSATYVLHVAITRGSSRLWWGMYAVLVAAGMWTNYFTALAWMSHAIWVFYEYRHASIFRSWKLAIIGAVVLYLPWLPLMLFRYGEIQVNGFWIKPISIDTLASAFSQSIVYKSAAQTETWLAIAVVTFIVSLFIAGRKVYSTLKKENKKDLRLILAMSALPVVLLVVGSLPPLRSSFVYRYVLVSAAFATIVTGIIVCYVRFKKHNSIKRAFLVILSVALFGMGAFETTRAGGRNLDTGVQNKLSQVIMGVKGSSYPAPIVLRSPYSYYAAHFYGTDSFPVKYIYSQGLEKVGSTKPLFDHSEESIRDFNQFNKVWLVGEDRYLVAQPKQGSWRQKDSLVEYDDATKKPVAFASYYERIE